MQMEKIDKMFSLLFYAVSNVLPVFIVAECIVSYFGVYYIKGFPAIYLTLRILEVAVGIFTIVAVLLTFVLFYLENKLHEPINNTSTCKQ